MRKSQSTAVPQPDTKSDNAPKVELRPPRTRVVQTDIPVFPITKCRDIPEALWEYYNGRGAPPLRLATTMKISPQSSNWRYKTGACVAYGLTEGAYGAAEIKLSELGRRMCAPTSEGDDRSAIREAVLRPKIVGDFLKRLNNRKLPPEDIAQNMLVEMGVPKERSATTLQMIVENAREAGFLLENKGVRYVDLGAPADGWTASDHEDSVDGGETLEETIAAPVRKATQSNPETAGTFPIFPPKNNRVFISHGANREIVNQIKQILKFGKYEPVVAVESETPALPISQKVFDAMRGCFAGVINVHSEGEWQAPDGTHHLKLNENVLIEIGAAMALYPGRFVLLVQRDIKLPSNINGLSQCRYSGNELGFEAAMALLNTFNEFEFES